MFKFAVKAWTFLRCYGLKVKFLVSLVAAVVGISFCVATGKIRKA